MAGLIKSEDLAAVKERSSIEDVVSEHVTLRRSGARLVGLCPFHDEKSPSFGINPGAGFFHCFGCGEGGDVISFVQKIEHLSFTEAVERLAQKLGMELRYEDGGSRPRDEGLGRRSRLVEAHRVAQEFYGEALLAPGQARTARDFMRARGFDGKVAKHFGVGFAPRGGEDLVRHLRAKGFSDDEIVTGGLAGRGSRGLYDRFRGRLVWPIRDITGDTVGFGARRLFDDDRIEAKYLNTSETPIYKKSSVLYGLDLAKKQIASQRTAVVVEGYTDVMACHLAGVDTAVATCGTAFGSDHIKMLRRLMRDEAGLAPAKVVFTFDGDAAGQKAAMRAFADDQKWSSQSFVAVERSGKDPCELRQAEGDPAVQALVEDAVPMFEFAVRTTIKRFDLATAEGRIQAVRAVAPIVAAIRDRSLQPEYVREVSGLLGLEVEQVATEVSRAGALTVPDTASDHRRGRDQGTRRDHDDHDDLEPTAAEQAGASASMPMPDPRDPVTQAERQLLQVMLQFPTVLAAPTWDLLTPEAFAAPAHRAIFEGVVAARADDTRAAAWVGAVSAAAPAVVTGLVSELAVAPLPTRMDALTGLPSSRYVTELFDRVRTVALRRRVDDALSEMRRLDHAESPDPARSRQLALTLQSLQTELAQIKESMT
ncbi:DNA primase [Terracoccus luteus]|uniref:DNA primase n=1 Tax=Terracoccus luteus TaxID=53356 RepID=A0A495Y169_9MICO|nr:DNA primase [Terracoccus luteus]MBB2985043.1 DNA primase [Terracoccus luteus]MCP2170695.1 DNA primase [Terracoccus luteus]RKT77698.1 DNA primase [Terracoccus luteus]